jgi:hypothetical protein
MPTLQETAIAAGLAAALAVAGEPVQYAIADTTCTLPWTAIRGRSQFETTSAAGIVTTFDTVDWIGAAAELSLGAGPIVPAAGDRVMIETDYGYDIFEVLAIPGEKPYRFDPSRTQLRIHTKKVDG